MDFTDIFGGKNVLFFVAHADDEVIFFGQLLIALQGIAKSVTICMMSTMRHKYFMRVCDRLKYHGYMYETGYCGDDPFLYEENYLSKMAANISKLIEQFNPQIVITHGQYSDYPHYHFYHRLIYYAVVKAIRPGIMLFSRGSGIIKCNYNKKMFELLNLYPMGYTHKYAEFVRQPEEFSIVQI